MSTGFIYHPDLLLQDGKLVRGRSLAVTAEGVIAQEPEPGATVVRLSGQVLLPGLVNAHSHAFQRCLRARTEYASAGQGDFWSWRELMYQAAERLDPEGLYAISRQAFLEMARAGMTSVGEFHYLHHAPGGRPYEDRGELARRVIAAAREVGLRIALLRVGYARAGFEVPPNPRQARFIDPDVDVFLSSVEQLRVAVGHDPLVSVALAPHSVRAVPRSWLEALTRIPRQTLHMHVAEQAAEIAACQAEHGRRPFELLDDVGLLSDRFTAVHAIHINAAELAQLAKARAMVCACPSTERNLGDGVVGADAYAEAGIRLALGSDSQAGIDLLAEARQLELHLRLVRQRRAVLDPGTGDPSGLASRLLEYATRGGATSLGLPTGELVPGRPADFFTLNLEHPSLLGIPEEALLAGIMFGAERSAISEVVVQGRTVVSGGEHPLQEEIGSGYRKAMQGLLR